MNVLIFSYEFKMFNKFTLIIKLYDLYFKMKESFQRKMLSNINLKFVMNF